MSCQPTLKHLQSGGYPFDRYTLRCAFCLVEVYDGNDFKKAQDAWWAHRDKAAGYSVPPVPGDWPDKHLLPY